MRLELARVFLPLIKVHFPVCTTMENGAKIAATEHLPQSETGSSHCSLRLNLPLKAKPSCLALFLLGSLMLLTDQRRGTKDDKR